MKTRTVSTPLAVTLAAVALGAASFAEAQPARLEPMPGQFPGLSLEPGKIRDLLGYLDKEKLPFEIEFRMTFRCLGAQCGGVIKPSSIPAMPAQALPCQDLSGDERIKCLEAYIRVNEMLR